MQKSAKPLEQGQQKKSISDTDQATQLSENENLQQWILELGQQYKSNHRTCSINHR